MARQTREEDREHTEVLSEGPIPEVNLPPASHESEVIGDARLRNPLDEPKGPEVEYYRVTRGGFVQTPGGVRAQLREGKEIDSLNYDVRKITSQGIRLQRIDPAERESLGGIG